MVFWFSLYRLNNSNLSFLSLFLSFQCKHMLKLINVIDSFSCGLLFSRNAKSMFIDYIITSHVYLDTFFNCSPKILTFKLLGANDLFDINWSSQEHLFIKLHIISHYRHNPLHYIFTLYNLFSLWGVVQVHVNSSGGSRERTI